MNTLPIPTPHINEPKDAFTKTELMPGDPKRKKQILKNTLKNTVLVLYRRIKGQEGISNGKWYGNSFYRNLLLRTILSIQCIKYHSSGNTLD